MPRRPKAQEPSEDEESDEETEFDPNLYPRMPNYRDRSKEKAIQKSRSPEKVYLALIFRDTIHTMKTSRILLNLVELSLKKNTRIQCKKKRSLEEIFPKKMKEEVPSAEQK